MSKTIEASIDVNVPTRTAYNQWTQFEDFPQFMEGVEEVRQLDDKRLHWVAEVGGATREWDAEITRQVPDSILSWRAEGAFVEGGTVSFEEIDATTTRVSLGMVVEPETLMEKAGDMLGIIDRRVQGDLERFKDFIESRGTETGAWRGEIPDTEGPR